MEKQTETNAALDALLLPAFLARDGAVLRANDAAGRLLIQPGMSVDALLHTGKTEYGTFSQGKLYLTLSLSGTHRSASVTKVDGGDLFILEQESSAELTALALAAKQLREPLSRVMASAERLYDPESGEEALRLNRGLYQMLRILSNMSDAGMTVSRQETVNISGEIGEIFEKAAALLLRAGVAVNYQGPEEPIYGIADRDQLERAILNILSNAAKFLNPGKQIDAALIRRDRMLQLSIQDQGSGICPELLPTVFSRYLREPYIEDARRGLGLGMLLIKEAAESHGGTVLIDTPETGGTRITLTLAFCQRPDDTLRSPILRVDRFGGRDHTLIELSDILPPELYGYHE